MGGVVAGGHEGSNFLAMGLTFLVVGGADDRAHGRGDDVAVGMNGDQEPTSFEREADATTGGGGAGGGAEAKRLAFELEELLGVDLAAVDLDTFHDATLRDGEARDFGGEELAVAEDIPGLFEAQDDRGGGGTT
jgi:hypothetical protein